jgi:hypothetical protein
VRLAAIACSSGRRASPGGSPNRLDSQVRGRTRLGSPSLLAAVRVDAPARPTGSTLRGRGRTRLWLALLARHQARLGGSPNRLDSQGAWTDSPLARRPLFGHQSRRAGVAKSRSLCGERVLARGRYATVRGGNPCAWDAEPETRTRRREWVAVRPDSRSAAPGVHVSFRSVAPHRRADPSAIPPG